MAYEIPVTQARAEFADLINRVVYGSERVVVTRHGKPLVALVSAADLQLLEELGRREQDAQDEQVISTVSCLLYTSRDDGSAGADRTGERVAQELSCQMACAMASVLMSSAFSSRFFEVSQDWW